MLSAKAIIVDVDGTVALRGDRDPYDESTVLRDKPNMPVIQAVKAVIETYSFDLLFVSGRTEGCRLPTVQWLQDNVDPMFEALYMRQPGDNRPDSTIKEEIYRRDIHPYWSVELVFDDRQQTVDMWRRIGLTCFQVAPGNF